MNKPIFVFDNNVLVSAAIFKDSIPAKALNKGIQAGKIAHSVATLNELRDVLYRKKFDKYLNDETRIFFFGLLVKEQLFFEPDITITACRDPKDNKFLELAVSAKAAAIITGDEDLLILNPFEKTAIMTPQAFLETEPIGTTKDSE